MLRAPPFSVRGALDCGYYVASNTNTLPTNGVTTFVYSSTNNFVEEQACDGLTFNASACALTCTTAGQYLFIMESAIACGVATSGFLVAGVDKDGDLPTTFGPIMAAPLTQLVFLLSYGQAGALRRLSLTPGNVVRPAWIVEDTAEAPFGVDADLDQFNLIAVRLGE